MTGFESRLSQERQGAIVKALGDKGVRVSPCRNCNGDAYVVFEVFEKLITRSSPGQEEIVRMPYVLIVCAGCGRKTEFSSAALGID